MALERRSDAARALRSPPAVGLAVVGAVVGAVAGLPALLVAGIGVAGYGLGAVASSLLTRAGGGRTAPRRERIDPFTLGEPWRLRIREALRAQARYDEALERTPEGPLRERLADIGQRIDAGVQECWRIAKQGDAIGDGMRAVRLGEVRASLAAAERDAGGGPDAESDPRVAALRAQVSSAERMTATAADADARLRLLSARMDEAAARAVELSIGAGTDADLAGLGSEVDEVVDQLESLRLALGEVGA